MLTNEEKIQRAREIYYRRNGINYRGDEKKKSKSHFMYIIIILLIGISMYVYQNQDKYITPEIRKDIKNFLNTKININSIMKKGENTENNQNVQNVQDNQNNEIEQMTEVQETPISVIMPLQGTITSYFGSRESADPRVGANHTGIDINGNERR